MPIYPIVKERIDPARAASRVLSGNFHNIKSFARIMRDRAKILLTVRGTPLYEFESFYKLKQHLGGNDISIADLERNLQLFFKALDHYHEFTKAIFNRRSVTFLGKPSIEIPMMNLGEDKFASEEGIVNEWVEEIFRANIFCGAEQIKSNLSTLVYYEGISLLGLRNMRMSGQKNGLKLEDKYRLFVILLFFEKALENKVFKLAPRIDLEEVGESIFNFAVKERPEAGAILQF